MHSVPDPTTYSQLTPDDLAAKLMAVTNTIEATFPKLTDAVVELAKVTALYDETYDIALLASQETTKEKREADARLACRLAKTPLGHPLAKRKSDLEFEVRARRDELHNLRAILSGLQSAAKPLQAVYSSYGSLGGP